MTKRLILTRHAKSSWDDPNMADHDRPLNERGKTAAADLGGWLASRGYIPEEVLCSDALRTRKTWSGIAPALPGTPILELKPALYHAGPDVMLAVLRHAKADTVMMIGHNPGITARQLCATLDLQPPNLVGMIKGLEKRSLLEKRDHPSDRRAQGLHLTEEGSAILEQAQATALALEVEATPRLTPLERVTLIRLLRKVYRPDH